MEGEGPIRLLPPPTPLLLREVCMMSKKKTWLRPRISRASLGMLLPIGVLILTACGPYKTKEVPQDSVYQTEKVITLDRKLHPWILADRVKILHLSMDSNEAGNPEVRLEVANRRSSQTSMDIRTIFKDEKGLPVYTSAWEGVVLSANSTYSYRCASTTQKATDFQVQIRSLK
jgi:hypothetical protein